MTDELRAGVPVLDLGPEPLPARAWVGAVWRHRNVLMVLAAKDFKVRYKRATFGVLWAVALPLVQSAVMITVFSRVARFEGEVPDYAGYVLAGMAAWAFVTSTVPTASTAIVDASSLTDKVWFPRALLVLSPILANTIGIVISVSLVTVIELVRHGITLDILLLVPGALLLLSLVTGACLVAAALHVAFRDVRFIIQAGVMVLFYATPILYPLALLEGIGDVVRIANPLVGVVMLFQKALAGAPVSGVAVTASVVWTVALLLLAVRLHHRQDRLFVDLL